MIEACVGIGARCWAPLAPCCCNALGEVFNAPLYYRPGVVWVFSDLFNLTPVGMLDGGRIVTHCRAGLAARIRCYFGSDGSIELCCLADVFSRCPGFIPCSANEPRKTTLF